MLYIYCKYYIVVRVMDWVEVFVFQGSARGEMETVECRDVL